MGVGGLARHDADWDWHSAVDDSPEELRAMFDAACAESAAIAAAGRRLGHAVGAERPAGTGIPFSLRWIIAHMIEEYARHNGHADLLRESIDGETGE